MARGMAGGLEEVEDFACFDPQGPGQLLDFDSASLRGGDNLAPTFQFNRQ